MTAAVEYSSTVQDTAEMMRTGDKRLRRVPVAKADHPLVGILALTLSDPATRQRVDLHATVRVIDPTSPSARR